MSLPRPARDLPGTTRKRTPKVPTPGALLAIEPAPPKPKASRPYVPPNAPRDPCRAPMKGDRVLTARGSLLEVSSVIGEAVVGVSNPDTIDRVRFDLKLAKWRTLTKGATVERRGDEVTRG